MIPKASQMTGMQKDRKPCHWTNDIQIQWKANPNIDQVMMKNIIASRKSHPGWNA